MSAARMDDDGGVNKDVQDYIDAIPSEHRPLFDRVHGLILQAHPDAQVVISYDIPTYKVAGRKLFVGVWRHGISIYGWPADRDAGFAARHPELLYGKRTIRVRPQDAAHIADDELRDFAREALRE